MEQNSNEASYTDIDIYGRGFDGVFGPGAEKIGRRNALLALKAKQDFKVSNTSNGYIDYDLYGRGDPRIFGVYAHKINAESTAEHLKQRRSRRPGNKSLRAILAPFGKPVRFTRFFNRKSSTMVQTNTEAHSMEASDRSIASQQLEPIDDKLYIMGNTLPSEESHPPLPPGTITTAAKRFDSENKTGTVGRFIPPDTGPSRAAEVYGPQRSNDFHDLVDLDIASVAEVSSPEVSDVGTSSKSSQSDVQESETESEAAEKGEQSLSSHVSAGDNVPADRERKHSTSRLMPDQPGSNHSSANLIRAGDSFAVQEDSTSQEVSQTGDNGDSASTSRTSSSSEVLSPNASSGSASSSSLGIDAVAVTEVEGSDSHTRSAEDSVESERDASSGDSDSFTMENSKSSSTLNVALLENQEIDASPGNQKERLAHLFERGSIEPSLNSGTATPKSSDFVNNSTNETSSEAIATRGIPPNGDGMQIDGDESISERVVVTQLESADRDDMEIQRKVSGIEQVAVNRKASANQGHLEYDREAARNSSFAYVTETEDAGRNTMLRKDDEYIAEEAVFAEYDSDDSDTEEFLDALDSVEDSDHSMAGASSSEIVSSSMYSSAEDSDELESSEEMSREHSKSARGSSPGMSNHDSGFHHSASTGKAHGNSGSLGGSSTARSQGLSSSHHVSSNGSGPNLVSSPGSSALASKHSSDETESSFYSQVFESTVADEDDNSDVFLTALSTPHEEPQL